jgi:endonuclease/exonuclease/phosphatase family metal-dependent hydrolase
MLGAETFVGRGPVMPSPDGRPAASPAGAHPASAAAVEPPRSGSLRIVAYNFLSGGSRTRADHWARLHSRLAPDVVLAQECRLPGDSRTAGGRAAGGDAFLWTPVAGRRWGSAILLRGLHARPVPVPGFEGWVVGAELPGSASAPARPVRLFSIHCPAGERGYVRTMHAILDRIARLRGDADLVLGGDFNVAVGHRQPGERLQVSAGERTILDRLAGEFELISCWQAANPGRRLAQTLRWSGDRRAPYHCDGIFAPAAWGVRLASCRVVTGSRWARLSDHNPVFAEFTMDR